MESEEGPEYPGNQPGTPLSQDAPSQFESPPRANSPPAPTTPAIKCSICGDDLSRHSAPQAADHMTHCSDVQLVAIRSTFPKATSEQLLQRLSEKFDTNVPPHLHRCSACLLVCTKHGYSTRHTKFCRGAERPLHAKKKLLPVSLQSQETRDAINAKKQQNAQKKAEAQRMQDARKLSKSQAQPPSASMVPAQNQSIANDNNSRASARDYGTLSDYNAQSSQQEASQRPSSVVEIRQQPATTTTSGPNIGIVQSTEALPDIEEILAHKMAVYDFTEGNSTIVMTEHLADIMTSVVTSMADNPRDLAPLTLYTLFSKVLLQRPLHSNNRTQWESTVLARCKKWIKGQQAELWHEAVALENKRELRNQERETRDLSAEEIAQAQQLQSQNRSTKMQRLGRSGAAAQALNSPNGLDAPTEQVKLAIRKKFPLHPDYVLSVADPSFAALISSEELIAGIALLWILFWRSSTMFCIRVS